MAELILALDLSDGAAALRLLDRIPGVGWVKVGSILGTREGATLVRELGARGHSVFLDLKWHDIPNTVRGAVAAAAELGVRMATVHSLGGHDMMTAAAAAAPPDLALVAVTVLTSHNRGSYARALGSAERDLADEAVRQARMAVGAGLAGVVSSSQELGSLRAALGPGPLLVVPGIRRPGDRAGDQQRTATAGEAVRAGADYLVIGRSVLEANDPAAAWESLGEEIQ